MKKSIYLTVVIPAFNEINNLKKGVLEDVYEYLHKQDYTWEVLVVDDGSTDTTSVEVGKFASRHKNFTLLKEPHRGKAGTVIAGMLKGSGKNIVFIDMDMATPIEELEHLLPKLDAGYDIAIGSRSGRKGAPIVRKLMAYGFTVLRFLILRLPFRDTQCGFKGFSRKATQTIFQRMLVYTKEQSIKGSAVTAGFDLEVLYVARKLGFKVAEVPVNWHDAGDRGGHGVNPLKDSWQGLIGLLQVRKNALLGKYKI